MPYDGVRWYCILAFGSAGPCSIKGFNSPALSLFVLPIVYVLFMLSVRIYKSLLLEPVFFIRFNSSTLSSLSGRRCGWNVCDIRLACAAVCVQNSEDSRAVHAFLRLSWSLLPGRGHLRKPLCQAYFAAAAAAARSSSPFPPLPHLPPSPPSSSFPPLPLLPPPPPSSSFPFPTFYPSSIPRDRGRGKLYCVVFAESAGAIVRGEVSIL